MNKFDPAKPQPHIHKYKETEILRLYQEELNQPDVKDMILKMKESGIVLANAKKKYAAAFNDDSTKAEEAKSDEKLDKTNTNTEAETFHQRSSTVQQASEVSSAMFRNTTNS